MARASTRTTAKPGEAIVVAGICFGWAIWESVRAVLAGFPVVPFTDAGNLWLVAIELVCSVIALGFLHARGLAVGTLRPLPSVVGTLQGTGLYLAAWLLAGRAVGSFATGYGDQPIVTMVSEADLSLGAILVLAAVNAPFEEIFLLGVLVRGLREFGPGVAVGVSVLVRVLCHLYQGPLGALSALVFGLVVTVSFVLSDKLWPAVFCHLLGDIIPFLWTPGP